MSLDPNSTPFDRALLARQRQRWWGGHKEPPRFLFDHVAEDLADRLSLVQRRFETAADLGGDDGSAARRVLATGQVGRMVEFEGASWREGADEIVPLGEDSVDLVVSNLGLHLTNDTPGVLLQIRRALRPDGLLLASLLGGDTLTELRQSLLLAETERSGGASPRVVPFADLRAAGGLLQRAGFALPVIDGDRLTVRYDTMFDLARDLRAMGAANVLHARSRRPGTRGLFLRAAEVYRERFSDADGRLRATFDVISLSGWRPHESQQKPLKPGSARTSLRDVLPQR